MIFFTFVINCVRVQGESMLPTLKPNDAVFYIKTEDIEVGDIIIYESDDYREIVHRVIKVENGTYITKGDNNIWYDWTQDVTLDNIKGKMIFKIP
jgi:signal peptidase I